jgi:hypothetical protein
MPSGQESEKQSRDGCRVAMRFMNMPLRADRRNSSQRFRSSIASLLRRIRATDLFASSLLQTASASRRLRDSCDIASSLWLEASRRLQESYYFASSLLRESSDLAAVACEQDSNSTSTDLFASILWKDGPFGNGTDLFASSLLQTASASRRLRDVMDDIKPLTQYSVDNALA